MHKMYICVRMLYLDGKIGINYVHVRDWIVAMPLPSIDMSTCFKVEISMDMSTHTQLKMEIVAVLLCHLQAWT